jgi:Zinc finger C-x8-C-x5-C-x3-H type (and similar)
MVVALAAPVAIDFAGVMERAGSFGDPQQHRQQHGGPPGSPAMPVYYYPQQPYYGYQPQSPQHHQQPAPVQPYPSGMPPFQAHGYPYQVWYGPPQAGGPAPRAAHSIVDLPQAHPGFSPPRPLMRPAGMMPGGMVPPAMQSPVPAPRFQQERAPTPRGKFLIPGNGVRSSSTSSVKRGSTGSTVRSLSDDVTEQRAAAAAAAVDDVPDTLEAPAPPLTQQQKDDSNAHAPCAFFLRTGTCAYGSRYCSPVGLVCILLLL